MEAPANNPFGAPAIHSSLGTAGAKKESPFGATSPFGNTVANNPFGAPSFTPTSLAVPSASFSSKLGIPASSAVHSTTSSRQPSPSPASAFAKPSTTTFQTPFGVPPSAPAAQKSFGGSSSRTTFSDPQSANGPISQPSPFGSGSRLGGAQSGSESEDMARFGKRGGQKNGNQGGNRGGKGHAAQKSPFGPAARNSNARNNAPSTKAQTSFNKNQDRPARVPTPAFNGARRDGPVEEPTERTKLLSPFAYDYATTLYSHLRKDNIRAPQWPSDIRHIDAGAADSLKTGFRKYREQVYKSLRKAEIIDDPEKRRRLEDALAFKGICEEMCPEYEQIQRIAEHDVMSEEKDNGKFDRARMVKKFGRSAAGQDAPLPQDVRSVDALRRTTDYLFKQLLNDENLAKIHNFLWDRTRAVRRDFTFHSQKTPEEMKDLVYCFETITRFHAVSLHVLSQEGVAKADFESKQEIEQLGRTILSLIEAYDACREMNVACENEAEFRAYYLLLNAHDSSIAQRIPTWGKEFWFDSEEVQIALSLTNAMDDVRELKGPIKPKQGSTLSDVGFANYFAIVEDPKVSYTMGCVAEIHFTTVRQNILKNLVRGYARNRDAPRTVTAEDLNRLLRFDTVEEAQRFAEAHDFEFSTEHPAGKPAPPAPYLVLNDRRKHIPSPRIQHAYSGKLVERKRNGQSVSYAIYNTIFEEVTDKPAEVEMDSPDSLFVDQDDATMGMFPPPQIASPQVSTSSLPGSPFGAPASFPSVFQQSPQAPKGVLSTYPFGSPASGSTTAAVDVQNAASDTTRSLFGSPTLGNKPGTFSSPVQANQPNTLAAPSKESSNTSIFANPPQAEKPNPFATLAQGNKLGPFANPAQAAKPPSQVPVQWGAPAAPSTVQPSQIEKPVQQSPFSAVQPSLPSTTVTPEQKASQKTNPFAATDAPAQQPSSRPTGLPPPTFAPIFGQSQGGANSFAGPAASGAVASSPVPAAQQPLPAFPPPATAVGNKELAKPSAPSAPIQDGPRAHSSMLGQPSQSGLGSGTQQLGTIAGPTIAPGAGMLAQSPQVLPAAAPAPVTTSSTASASSLGVFGSGAAQPQLPALFQPHQPSLAPAVPPPVAAPTRDLMGDFTKWFVVGDNGVVEQFTEYVVSDLVTSAFEQWTREEQEKKQREEDDASWREARAYRTSRLQRKFFYRWQEAARDRATTRLLLQGKDKMRAYREQKILERRIAKEKAEQAEREARIEARRKLAADRLQLSMIASAEMEKRISTEQQLLASGIFSGLRSERAAARRVMHNADNGTSANTSGYHPYAESTLVLEPRRPTSSTRGPAFTSDSSIFNPEKSEGWKTRSLREKLGLGHKRSQSSDTSVDGSSVHRKSLSAQKTTNFSRKRSADESSDEGRGSKRKQLPILTDGFKTTHWNMRARGFVLMPNGEYIPESIAKTMREGKRYPGLGDYGLDAESIAQESVADYDMESVDNNGVSPSSLQLRLAQLKRTAGMSSNAAYNHRTRSRSASYVNSPSPSAGKRKRPMASDMDIDIGTPSPSAHKKSSLSREASQSMLRDVQKMVGELKDAMDVLEEDRVFFREQTGILGDEA